MRRARVVFTLIFLSALPWTLSCRTKRSGDAGSGSDTARPMNAASNAAADWANELGQMLVVPSDSDNTAVVLYPNDPNDRLMGSQLTTLVNAAGDTTRVKLVALDSQECGDAPVVRLNGAAPPSCSVGLIAHSAKLLRTDSIEALSSADSARLAADLARLASALTTQPGSRFTGLPFAVLGAHRFESDERQYLVGHLVRRLNQEAAPREERTFVIAERPAATRGEP